MDGTAGRGGADDGASAEPLDAAGFVRLIDAARAARNWGEMARLARRFAASWPDHAGAPRAEAQAQAETGELAAAEQILQHAAQRFAGHPWLRHDLAELAERQGDRDLALSRWVEAAQRFPHHPRLVQRAAAALQLAGKLQESQRLLAGAETRFAGDPGVLQVWAEQALATHAIDEAIRRTTVLRDRFPERPWGYLGLANALFRKREYEAADAVAEAGVQRFPMNLDLLILSARIANQRMTLAKAERRWQAALTRDPRHPECIAGLAETLHLDHRHVESDAMLRAGVEALPECALLSERLARSAMQVADWPEAVRRWRKHLARFATSGVGHQLLGQCLIRAGEREAGEAALMDAMRQLSDDGPCGFEHAWSAFDRGDYREAERRWLALQARLAPHPEIMQGLLHARLAMAQLAEAGSGDEALAPEILLSRFESLGENCEFGLLQRSFGLEPLSLFRWASVMVSGLIHGLEEGFTDVGNPANVSLKSQHVHGEYYVRDKAYRFGAHTHVQVQAVEEAKFFRQSCRRLRFLGHKLAEDLRSGEKMFVHLRHPPLPLDQLWHLHRAMRRYGQPWLLLVQVADDLHAPGTARLTADGLVMGYIGHFGNATRRCWDIDTDNWLALCRKALALREAAGQYGLFRQEEPTKN